MTAIASKLYKFTIKTVDPFVPSRYQALWDHPAGPKYVHFWAPLIKWGLVIAGLGDLARPAEKISIPQSAALFATGVIWSRYSIVIKPKNWSLFSVNVFVAFTACYQLQRGYRCQMLKKQQELTSQL